MLFFCPHGLFTRPTLGLASIGVSGLYCRWTSCAIHLVAVVVILSHGCSDQNLTPCAFARVITHFHISEITIPCVCMALYGHFLREIGSASMCPAPRSLVLRFVLIHAMPAYHPSGVSPPSTSTLFTFRVYAHSFGFLESDKVCSVMFSSAMLLFLFAVVAVRYPGLLLSQHTRGVS